MVERTIPIVDMDCASCAKTIEKELSKLSGVGEISISILLKKATVKYDPDRVDVPQIEEKIEKMGYRIGYKKYEGVFQRILNALRKTPRSPRSLSDHEFEDYVLRSRRPVMVEFGSASCASCNALGQVLKDLEEGYRHRVYFYRMDVRKTGRWREYNITTLPTLVYFVNGKEVWRQVGLLSRDELLGRLDGMLQ